MYKHYKINSDTNIKPQLNNNVRNKKPFASLSSLGNRQSSTFIREEQFSLNLHWTLLSFLSQSNQTVVSELETFKTVWYI